MSRETAKTVTVSFEVGGQWYDVGYFTCKGIQRMLDTDTNAAIVAYAKMRDDIYEIVPGIGDVLVIKIRGKK